MIIYLASPYSHELPFVRKRRFEQVCECAAKMMAHGLHVFSPIAHTHPIAEAGALPTDWNYWEEYDRKFLSISDKLIVLKLRGWKQSKGVAAEIRIARELGKPVEFMEPLP